MTVRRHLDMLERSGLLRRVRGGALDIDPEDEGTFEVRLRDFADCKQAIAMAVAPLVGDGDVIAVDASTTSYYLVQEILGCRNLTVVTNGRWHATLLMERSSSATVLIPGGVLRRSSAATVGPIGDVLTGRGRISAGFFGVVSVSSEYGLMEASAEEAQTKRVMSDACDRVYGLFDSSKFAGFGLHPFTDRGRITATFTDSSDLDRWNGTGIAIAAVPLKEPAAPRAAAAGAGRHLDR